MRVLTLLDLLDVFLPGAIEGKVRIGNAEPLVGELLCDVTGSWFLAPEEDYRGGGMQSIRVHNLPVQAMRRYRGRLVKITGEFEDAQGLSVQTIALEHKPLE